MRVMVMSEDNEVLEKASYAEIESFFDSAPPLVDGPEIKRKLDEFIGANSSRLDTESGSRVVCVTSGGTTVPLEQQCVRYIDNFASGHRGAISTEYFLKAGYAVVFLYRRGSCQPYCGSLPDDPLLECFEVNSKSEITVHPSHVEMLKIAISENRSAVTRGALLKLPFITIFEYLQMLQLIAVSMRRLGSSALFYLAAAVSDFYVPWDTMAVHKIQSGSGPLDMRLVEVPKMLSVLRKVWAPTAFCISFKLETDTYILLKKADLALKRYDMHMVIANELLTRKDEVIVVTKSGETRVRRDQNHAGAVECPLVELVVERHSSYINSKSPHIYPALI